MMRASAIAIAMLALAPGLAAAGTVSVSLSGTTLTVTGSATADGVYLDWTDPADDPDVDDADDIYRFIASDGTTFTTSTSACVLISSRLDCDDGAVINAFVFNMGDGNDAVRLRTSDPATGADAVTVNLDAGNDTLTTFGSSLCFIGSSEPCVPGSWTDAITANGGDGTDTLNGSPVTDTLNGGNGIDSLTGGDGDDTLNGNADDDTLNGGNGVDTLSGSTGADKLNGGAGNDSLSGHDGNDTLAGDAGDDTLTPSTGTDTADGGDGVDTVSYATPLCLAGLFGGTCPAPIAVNVSLDGAANDGGAGENDQVGPGIENITGGSAADVLVGDDGANVISGNAGDDVLQGAGGNDVLNGSSGADTVRGGGGSDDLQDSGTDAGADTADFGDMPVPVKVDLAGGPGMGPESEPDSIAATFENIIGGGGNDDLNGSTAGNTITGGPGNDTIDGLDGDDVLRGGDGRDRFDAGAGNDTVQGEGGGDHIEGGAGNDTLEGGDGADTITGGPGGTSDADTMSGGQDRDLATYSKRTSGVTVTLDDVANDGGANEKDNVGSDFEAVFGGFGPDTFRLDVPVRLKLVLRPILVPTLRPALFSVASRPVISRVSLRAQTAAARTVTPGRWVQGSGGNDLIIGTAGNDVLIGGGGKDKIQGLAGADSLTGGSGDDQLDAGADNDVLDGNEGDDQADAGDGDDLIRVADRLGRDKTLCGLGRDTYLRDVRDLLRKASSCDRTIGRPKLGEGTKEPEPGEPEPPPGEEEETCALGDDAFDPTCMAGETGDEPIDVNQNGIPDEEELDLTFGLEEFDSFGAEFEFGEGDWLGEDQFGDFGDAKDIATSIMKLPTKTAKIGKKGKARNRISLKLVCPKTATRRCIGDVTVTIKPKKGKTRELGSTVFRTTKGKTATLKFKLTPKQRKLIPKGKKGIKARVVVEARDSGDLLFGIDQTVTLRR